jgi:hypothetical protein
MIGFALRTTARAGIFVGFILASACSSQTTPAHGEHWKWGTIAVTSEYKSMTDTMESAVKAGDFAKLDALDAEYREGTTSYGEPKLPLYYGEVTFLLNAGFNSHQCDDPFWSDYLDKWQAASPRSPAPIIVRAMMLDKRAWCYRGEGTSAEVAASAWQPFRENIDAAVALLEKNKPIASVDPQFYEELEDLYVSQQRTRADFNALLAEASARYPYYYDLYDAAFRNALPQWGGSLQQMDAIARFAVEKTRARDGASSYFRVYWARLHCRCFRDLEAMDWSTMRVAMADLAQRYPNDATYIRLIKMSCNRGDADEARKYFAKLNTNDASTWRKETWDRCRQLVGPSPQPFPQNIPQ